MPAPTAMKNTASKSERFERFDVALQYVAKLTAGQHHPGDKGAESRGETHGIHQQRNSHHQRESGGGQGFGDFQ